MFSKSLACVVVTALLGHTLAVQGLNRCCRDITIPISVVVDTIVVPPLPDFSKPSGFPYFLTTIPSIVTTAPHTNTTGTYNITATYCAPKGGHPDEIQLVVHGASYTKDYWMGGAWHAAGVYSWTNYANDNGFATLAIDQLGNGLSAHPDPAQEVQQTTDIEVLNILAQKIRSGEITGTPSGVVYVGHSHGSIMGTMLAVKYPNSIDKLVLTGYVSDFSHLAATMVAGQYISAKYVDPARFFSLPEGYITQSAESARTSLFYTGSYDPDLPRLDFATKGTLAVGETLGSGIVPVSNFRGPVFILTGDKDKAFCGTDPSASCEPLIQATASQFPSASNFEYFMPKNTGHSLNFHHSAQQSFEAVTDWLLRMSRTNPTIKSHLRSLGSFLSM